jgi:hypothetical protein
MIRMWADGQLFRRAVRRRTPRVVFGFMHEDPAPEVSLLRPHGSALCILSAGDVAFALCAAGARRVIAIDPNPAQVALVRLKLAAAAAGWTARQAAAASIRDAISFSSESSWLRPQDRAPCQAVERRPCLAAGDVDKWLRRIARWYSRLLPAALTRILDVESRREISIEVFNNWRWRLAWRLFDFVIRLRFARNVRRELPPDFCRRLRSRLEQRLAAPNASENPWLRRLLAATTASQTLAASSSWPDAAIAMNVGRLSLQQCLLSTAIIPDPLDLVATSNIFDTTPASALCEQLDSLRDSIRPSGVVVVRSLFREAGDWPAPPPGWTIAHDATADARSMDRSVVCPVSIILRRTDNLATRHE